MTAVACIRVVVAEDVRLPAGMDLATLVAKIASAYLETTWLWPRRFALVAPFAFALSDPRAASLDANEIQAMAQALHLKLFGDGGGENGVRLLMLEGEPADVMGFASARAEELLPLLDGNADGFVGRIFKITRNGVVNLTPAAGPAPGVTAVARADVGVMGRARRRLGWVGIYAVPRRKFVASYLTPRDDALKDVSDELMLELDTDALLAAVDAVGRHPEGVLFVSFDFTALVRPATRAALKLYIDNLPPEMRARLGVTVRGAPRDPSFSALSQINALLRPRFSLLDIQITDPGFCIDGFPMACASSVTLKVEGDDQRACLTIRRFLDQARVYAHKGVAQGVSNLRRFRELDLCRQMRAPFVAGPAVSGMMDSPLGDVAWPLDELPYRIDSQPRDRRPERDGARAAPEDPFPPVAT